MTACAASARDIKLSSTHGTLQRVTTREEGMTDYRCYLLDARGAIRSVQEIDSINDGDALKAARDVFARQPHFFGFELWQRNRRVHLEQQPT